MEVLNGQEDFGALYARRGIKTRKKARTTVEIVSEPLLHDFDEHQLGAEPALAIRDILERQTGDITEFASPTTQRKRREAEEALEAGVPWAVRRYSGGRTGKKPPNQSQRLFNDSGRLREGWFVRENKEDRTWTVNVPVNRLDPDTWGPAFNWMLNRLKQLVPVLGDTRKLFHEPDFNAAVAEAYQDLIVKGKQGATDAGLKRLRQMQRRALKNLLRLGQAMTGR